MTEGSRSATLTVESIDLPAVDADVLTIPVCQDEPVPAGDRLDQATGGDLARACSTGEFQGKTHELYLATVVACGWQAKRVMLVGAGRRQEYGAARARTMAATVAIAARERRIARLAYVLEPVTRDRWSTSAGTGVLPTIQAVAEGLTLGEHVGGRYKTSDRPQPTVAELAVVVPGVQPDVMTELRAAAARGRTLGECSNLARALADEPGGILTPQVFASRAAGLVAGTDLTLEVLGEDDLSAMGMGLLLGVSRGSHQPPRMLVIRYDPAGASAAPLLGLVGKGITFDAGGISMKPPLGMERMKDDMSGGAAVVCAMRAIGLLKAPIRVIGVVPCAENMPGGGAIRPGDVLTGASGKTVEVIDTDAEGRLILADALWFAVRQGATHLVDVATLTGACQIALGKTTSGLMGRPTSWVEHVRAVADRAGDRSWILPLFEDYRDQLRSEIADLANVGGRPAGAITAAMFLREFAGDLPWTHMDIAGTSWQEEAKPFAPKGPSGVAVRTLAELAFTRF
jgi:leucyl aminopeptidase